LSLFTATLAMSRVTYAPPRLEEPIGPLVWVLEQPIVSAIVLAAVGVVVATLLSRRGQGRHGLAVGGALVAAGLAALGVGWAVETERERIEARSGALVSAAVDGDPAKIEPLLIENVALAASGRTMVSPGLPTIVGLAETQRDAGVIESWRLSRLQSKIEGPNVGTTQFRVRVTPTRGRPTLSWWKLHWRRDAQGVWRVGTIDCLAINGREAGGGIFDWLEGAARGSRIRSY